MIDQLSEHAFSVCVCFFFLLDFVLLFLADYTSEFGKHSMRKAFDYRVGASPQPAPSCYLNMHNSVFENIMKAQ